MPPTIKDVATRARTSTFTVSAVLNQSARVSPELTQRVLKAAAELDYTINRIASSLQTRRTFTIGILIPDIANPFFANVVRGVEDVCRESNYSLLIGNTTNQAGEQARYLQLLRSRQVDGMLLFMAADSEPDLAPLVERQSPPLVFLGRRPQHSGALYVVADNRLGARLAVDHLIARGHQRIAILTGQASLSAAHDRIDGWRESHRAAGLKASRSYIKAGDWTAATARRQTRELLQFDPPPTAMFASNFLILTGILAALREQRLRVPTDVEVMSADDSEWLDVFDPPISVVVQPSHEMGAVGARLLLNRLAAPERSLASVVLRPELKIRVPESDPEAAADSKRPSRARRRG